MELEIRKAKPEEMEEFNRVAGTALMMPASDALGHDLTLCAFIDGKLATSYAAWHLTARINGGDVPAAGITMVGTLPVYRRLGCLRKVTARHFEILHEEGKEPVSALYASRAAIYRRYGYSVAVTNCSYTVEPRYLQFTAGHESVGAYREAEVKDYELLYELYDRFIEKRTGYLRRNEYMWKRMLYPNPREGSRQTVVIYEENGIPQGYLVYTATLITEGRNRGSQNISIRDIVWLKPSAYRAIWDYFSRMDLIIDIVWNQTPADDPLPHLLLEPRMLNKTCRDGMLARIVDISGALPKRRYDETGDLVFRVTDSLCPWNENTWKLEASPDGSRVEPVSETPQVEMPVSTLSMLYFGQISATEASRMGRLEVVKPESLLLWDRIMKTGYQPACADHF